MCFFFTQCYTEDYGVTAPIAVNYDLEVSFIYSLAWIIPQTVLADSLPPSFTDKTRAVLI